MKPETLSCLIKKIGILLPLLLAPVLCQAQMKISSFVLTNVIGPNDDLILNVSTGGTNYSTMRVHSSTLKDFATTNLTNITFYGETVFIADDGTNQFGGPIEFNDYPEGFLLATGPNGLIVTTNPPFNPQTNIWMNAPTGTVAMNVRDQFVLLTTPAQITGFTALSSDEPQCVTMTITNATPTNVQILFPNGFSIPDRTHSATASNESFIIIEMRYRPNGPTNGIVTQY